MLILGRHCQRRKVRWPRTGLWCRDGGDEGKEKLQTDVSSKRVAGQNRQEDSPRRAETVLPMTRSALMGKERGTVLVSSLLLYNKLTQN